MAGDEMGEIDFFAVTLLVIIIVIEAMAIGAWLG